MTGPLSAVLMGQLTRQAYAIADAAVVADIQCNAHRARLRASAANGGWVHVWDISPMVNPHEQPATCLDMNRQALDYALARGLVVPHDPAKPHLLRIVAQR